MNTITQTRTGPTDDVLSRALQDDAGRRYLVPQLAHTAMRLVIVRHGETDWTRLGRYTGTTEVGLTGNGRQQAASLPVLLGRVLQDQPCVLVSSPRHRATQTARLALPAHQVRVDPLVAEYDYGDFEGLTTRRSVSWHPAGTSGATGALPVSPPQTSARGRTRSCTRTPSTPSNRLSW